MSKCGTNCNCNKCCEKTYKSYTINKKCGCDKPCGCNYKAKDVIIENNYEKLKVKCGDNLEHVVRYINDAIALICEKIEVETLEIDCDEDFSCFGGADLSGLDFKCLTAPSEINEKEVFQLIFNWIEDNILDFDLTDFTITSTECLKTISINKDAIVSDVITNLVNNTDFINNISENVTLNIFADEPTDCSRNFLADTIVAEDGITIDKECLILHNFEFNYDISSNQVFQGFESISGVKYYIGGDKDLTVSSDIADIINWFNTFNITATISTTFPNVSINLITHGSSTFSPKLIKGLGEEQERTNFSVVNPTDICCYLKLGLDIDFTDNDTIADGSETKIVDGVNTTITGSGTTADPYKVNVTGVNGNDECFPASVISDATIVELEKVELTFKTWTSVPSFSLTGTELITGVRVNGILYPAPPALLGTDTSSVLDWLNGLNIGTFQYNSSGSNYTFVFDGYTDANDVLLYINNTPLSTIITFEAIDETCEILRLSDGMANSVTPWVDVTYLNGFTGDLQYRLNGDTVEVRGGTISRTPFVNQSTRIEIEAFTIPIPNSTLVMMAVGSERFPDDAFGGGDSEANFGGTFSEDNANQSFLRRRAGVGENFIVNFARINGVDNPPAAEFVNVADSTGGGAAIPCSIKWYIPHFQYYTS